MKQEHIAYQGEMMLLGWSESNASGRKVTFLLPPDTPEHQFKPFTSKQKGVGGQRFMSVLVQIDDHEQPVKQEETRPIASLAAMLCKDKDFWTWLNDAKWMGGAIMSEDTARDWLCEALDIESRRELDLDKLKGERFMRDVYSPYMDYRKGVIGGVLK
jgi:hypothetical protein